MSKEKAARNKRMYWIWDAGESYRQIARRFRLDVKTVYVIIQREKQKGGEKNES
jgi:Mor family transcriptional regulator